jgi:hypothetical protein
LVVGIKRQRILQGHHLAGTVLQRRRAAPDTV